MKQEYEEQGREKMKDDVVVITDTLQLWRREEGDSGNKWEGQTNFRTKIIIEFIFLEKQKLKITKIWKKWALATWYKGLLHPIKPNRSF
jgi:hypothetical protein